MSIALQSKAPELDALLDRFRERRELVRFKARGLKGLAAELGAAYGIGLPWKEIWRALAECGYEGSYRQFWRMAVRLTGTSAQKTQRRKNLQLPVVGKEVHQPRVRESGLSTASTEDKEKPAWQVQREEAMARLDREAELNRQRESRLKPTKVFKPSAFVGRGEN
jgi:hypothetical protein